MKLTGTFSDTFEISSIRAYSASRLLLDIPRIGRRLASENLARLPVHHGLWRMLRQKPANRHLYIKFILKNTTVP